MANDGLDDILADLRAAQTTEQFDAVAARVRSAAEARKEWHNKQETEEERRIFAGEDPTQTREIIAQLESELRTLAVAEQGIPPRRRAVAMRENRAEQDALGAEVEAHAKHLAKNYEAIRETVIKLRTLIFDTAEVKRKLDRDNDTLVTAGRADLRRNVNRVQIMAGRLDPMPGRLPSQLRALDAHLVSLASGKRVWSNAGATLQSGAGARDAALDHRALVKI